MGIKYQVWTELVEYDEEADSYGGIIHPEDITRFIPAVTIGESYLLEDAQEIQQNIINRLTLDSVITNLEVIRDETPCLGDEAPRNRCGCERFDYVLDLLREIKNNPIKEVSNV